MSNKSTKQDKINEFNKAEKQARTIKVKTLVLAILWAASIIGALIGGWTLRSDFASEVRSEVRDQMVVVQTPSKE